ncbi:MAG: response regulator transcription factor [Pseudonocardiales bacterium]
MTLATAEDQTSHGPAGRPTRLLIVDDHPMVRRGLQEMLHDFASVEVVGQAGRVDDCLECVKRLQPDVVLLDIKLGAENGFDACAEILRSWPGTKIVFLSAYEDEVYLLESARAGGSGYLLKGVHAERLVDAIERVQHGESVIDPHIIGRVPARAVGRANDWPGITRGLSRRESEVLQEMARGLDNRHIAQRLFISEETVKSHVKAVLRKLRARDRAQGVVIALRDRIVH